MAQPNGPITLVVFGKGGVGKSTVTSHLAVALTQMGNRVLLVGCDPKRDASARFHTDRRVSFIQLLEQGIRPQLEHLVMHADNGVDLIETGGAEPGTACAGRGVAGVCQILEANAASLFHYDVVLFDVLGDLVCGGFVAPLRYGSGQRVLVVTSEELASLFVANSVAKVTLQPSHRDSTFYGMVLNLRDSQEIPPFVSSFAGQLGTRILSALPRDPAVRISEARGRTALETHPDSVISSHFKTLAETVLQPPPVGGSLLNPMDADGFWQFVRRHGPVD